MFVILYFSVKLQIVWSILTLSDVFLFCFSSSRRYIEKYGLDHEDWEALGSSHHWKPRQREAYLTCIAVKFEWWFLYSVNRFCSKQILLTANMLRRTYIQKYTEHVQYTLMVIMHVFNSSFWLIHNFDNNLYYDPLTVNHLFIFIMSQSRRWK